MKILIISAYFPPKSSIASLRPYSFAKRWVELGHEVTVIAAQKHEFEQTLELDCSGIHVKYIKLPKLHEFFAKKAENSRKKSKQKNTNSTLSKFRNKLIKWKESRGILKDQRMPSHLDLWGVKAYRHATSSNWDLVVSTYSPYASHIIAFILKRKGLAKFWIADYRDLWTSSHMFSGLWIFRWIENIIERNVNRSADIVTTVSAPLAEAIEKKSGVENVYVIENGFDPSDLNSLPASIALKPETVNLVYTGSVYPGFRDPSPLFEAISRISKGNESQLLENLEVIFAGTGKDYVLNLAEKYEVSNWVHHVGAIDRVRSLQMQRDAHALIFLESDTPEARGVLTGKLFEYLNSKTEIWGIGISEKSESGKLILQSKSGFVFSRNHEALIERIIFTLKSGKKSPVNISKEAIERYDRRRLADRMLELAVKNNKDQEKPCA